MLVDVRDFFVKAGKGGNGSIGWDQYNGAVGGNGGEGGDVYFIGKKDITLLQNINKNISLDAGDGGDGNSKGLTGKKGEDKIVKVPVGTLITINETGEEFDITEENQKFIIAAGGMGGFGNKHFKSSTLVTPKIKTAGKKGQEYSINANLSIIGDVGLIGFPSAGKSSLLNSITNSKTKTAEYHFTTLNPNLGMFFNYTIVDLPGIIEDASKNRGLGHKFLKHIKKTKILMHLIDVSEDDLMERYLTIRKELEQFDPILAKKKEIIVLSKVDKVDEERLNEAIRLFKDKVMLFSINDKKIISNFKTMLSKELSSI